MKSLVFALLLSLLPFSCSMATVEEKLFTEEEMHQKPQIVPLPGSGVFVLYKFSKELTERQCYLMLAMVHDAALDADKVDEENSVIIFAYEGPERAVTVTADYEKEEVEFWETQNGSGQYTKKVYQGYPAYVLNYLIKGHEGNPEVTRGSISDEIRFSGSKENL